MTDWGGAVQLQKLTARDRIDLLERIASKTDSDGNIPISTALDEYVWAISKTVVSEAGELVFDSDAGRDFLYGERLDLLSEVFQAIADWNLGNVEAELEAAKKN